MASDGGQVEPSVLALEAFLRAWLSAQLGVATDQLDADEPLRSYGLDSRAAGQLLAALGDHLGRELPFDLVWSHPTLAALTRCLAAASGSADSATPRRSRARPASFAPAPVDTRESIAVVGLACRMPGAADKAAYWALLQGGRSAIAEVPVQREELAALRHDPSPGARFGGFLERVDGFDARFFGISPREASHMDPQQRLMLELAWEALEDAGIAPGSLRGSDAGVFAGVAWSDYLGVMQQAGPSELGPYSATGTHHSIIANRISYLLGLHGPSMAIDSACSSSLVAVHLACQSLRTGETSLAVVGSANLIVSPHSSLAMSRLGALSPSGRLAAFDAQADGYVRGEGGGVVVLKTTSQALADGDAIYCVIRGSAVNNDGRSNGLTAPNPSAQVEVLRSAYARSGIAPAEVDYIEAHGTGTELGDPIELAALGEVLGRDRDAACPLLVGSVKTNVGHLEAAAGIAGLIKLALCIERAVLPASLNHSQPNRRIAFERLKIAIPTGLRSWPSRPDGELRAGVSAFGFGGTNCHVVVSSPPAQAGVLALAASSETALQEEAMRFSRLLDAGHAPDAPVAFADGQRAALCFRSPGELREQLAALGAGNDCDGLLRGRTLEARPRIAFVCPPQGAQAIGMARGLLETEPAFLREVTACDESHARFAGWSLLEAFRAEPEHARLGEFEVVQPLLFAVSVGLAAVLRQWGLQPDAIIGHSIGEIAAAHLAGVLDRDQAMRVAVQYARALGSCKQPGAMAVAELSAAQTEARLVGREQRLCIAGYNGPTTTLISGDEAELLALARELSQSGVFCSTVALAAAAHSPQMATVSLPFEQALHGLAPRRARTALVSTLTATFVQGPELGAAYWPENLREPVRFGEGVQRLIEAGIDAFVELGPHPTLCRQIAVLQQQHGQRPCALGALRRAQRPHDDRRALLSTAAALYVRGAPIDWRSVNRNRGLPRCAAHAVARAAARTHSGGSDSGQSDPILVPISARNATALRELAGAVADRVGDGSIDSLADLACSFARHRDQHEQRLAVVASDVAEFSQLVGQFLAGQTRPGLVSGHHAGGTPRTAWVFSGQGSQWAKMGSESYRREPVFRQEFDRCEAALAPFLGSLTAGSLLQSCSLESALDRVELVAPAIFALQVSLAALFRSWGIEPAAVVGHSLGEIAAATVAGAICLEDAAAVVCARSRIAQRTEGQGAMALLELSLAQTRQALVGHEALLSVAASNGPRSTVVAGAPDAIAALLRQLEQREVFARLIRVRYASHSPQMEPFLEELHQAVASVRPSQSHTRFVSTVTGEFQPGTSLDGQYWVRNLRAPVLFSQAIEALAQDGCRTFIELSPHPILVNAIRQNLARDAQRCLALPSLIRNRPERAALLEALGTLYTRGHDIAWSQLARDGEGFVRLPTYRFQRERCWIGDRNDSGSQPLEAATPVGENRSARARLSALASGDRQAWLVDYLTGTFAAVLRLPRSECVSHAPLTALGLDSLTAAEARSQIEAELEQRCPLVWLLRGDITEIAAALAREVPSEAPAAYPLAEQRRSDPSSARTSLRLPDPLQASHDPIADSEAAGPAAASPVLPARNAPLGGEPRGTIEALIAQTWRELLGVERVGRGDDFFRLGGDASRAQKLRARLFEALDIELSGSSVLAHPTLEGLARQVYLQAESLPCHSASPIVPLRQQHAGRVRLVCFAHAGGGPAMYRPWTKFVSDEIEPFAVCLPGRELRLTERPCEDLRAACAEIAQALVPLLDRPLAFFGHSFGALLAFETARLLRRQSSLQPARLFLAGFPAADRWRSTASLRALPDADLLAWLAALGGQSLARSESEARSLHALLRSDLELLGSHRYSREAPLSCPILAFGGRRDALASAGDLEGWRSETSGGFALRLFEGDHFFLHPQQAALLEAIAADLQRL